MNCQELQHFVDSTLPGERDSVGLVEAQQHASTCPACAVMLVDMLRLDEELMGLSGAEADERLTQAVMRRIDDLSLSPAARPARRGLRGVLLMIAGVLILAGVSGWTGQWSEGLQHVLHVPFGGHWSELFLREGLLRFEFLLPTLIGAGLIALGLTFESETAARGTDS